VTLGTQFPEEKSNAVTNIVAGADLVPSKVHAGGTFVGGQPYDFTIGLTNSGDLPTTGTVTVEDTFDPAQFSSVNSAAGPGWACSTAAATVTCIRSDPLPAGQPYPPIVVNATVADPVPATVINTATVSGGGDIDGTNNSATDAGGAIAQADLAITKVADQGVVPARGEVSFTLDVVNGGPSTATAVQVIDTLAPNFAALEVTSDRGSCTTAVVCTLGAIAPGQRATITIRARVLDAAADSTVTNVATVTDTGTSEDPVSDNDSSMATLDVPVSSDLQVDKTFAPTPNPTAGELVTFTVAVTNAGPSTANNVSARDVLPAEFYAPAPIPTGSFTGGGSCEWLPAARNMRCAIDSLAPGQTETITITAPLAPDSRGKTVLNSIGAISDSVDPNPALATDTVSFVPIPAADLELTKVAPPDPVAPGALGRYTFQIANRGPSDAPDVIVRDTLPDGLSFVGDTTGECSAAGQALTCALGPLNAGASRELGVDVRVDPSLAGRTVRNTAKIASEPADPTLAPAEVVPSSNFDADDLVVAPLELATPPPGPPPPPATPPPGSPPPPAATDLALRVIAPTGTHRVGDATRWGVEVTNVSQATATNVSLTGVEGGSASGSTARVSQAGCGPQPPTGCALGSLAPGERRTIAVSLTPSRPGTLSLSGNVRAAETETRSDNNDDLATVRVEEGLTTLGIVVSVPAGPAPVGEPLPIAVTVRNRGTRPAVGFTVCQRLPRGLGVARRGGATLRNGRVCWRIARLLPGARRTLRITAHVSCVRARRTVITTVRGDNVRDRTARIRLRIACAAQLPRYTG
jgi:uncharacterized repeat protein (TIGR01451 family)